VTFERRLGDTELRGARFHRHGAKTVGRETGGGRLDNLARRGVSLGRAGHDQTNYNNSFNSLVGPRLKPFRAGGTCSTAMRNQVVHSRRIGVGHLDFLEAK